MEIAQQSETKRDFAPIFLFALTLFLSASLMFVLQPMFGKILLPFLGGAASVWNTCMVFYQGVLFIGYFYAHLLSSYCSLKKQLLVHGAILLLSLCFLPIGMPENNTPPIQGDPTLWLLGTLLVSIGLPFFILSTTSPLLQKWFSKIGHATSHDPYYLSIASNSGSLIALLSYPFLLEPQIGLSNQQQFWSISFLLLCACLFTCMILLKQHTYRHGRRTIQTTDLIEEPGLLLRGKWLILSFVPSSLLLGTTNYISIDIASVPMLWVIPLALYLISFIIVFSKYSHAVHNWMVALQPWVVAPFLIYYFSNQRLASFSLELLFNLLVFFLGVMVCHGELAKKRPATRYLTQYYLIMSFGGLLGGMFNSIVAPLIFNALYEYPLMIVATLLLNPNNRSRRQYLQKNLGKIIFCAYAVFFTVIFYHNYTAFTEELILGLLVIAVMANYFVFHKNPLYLALYGMIIVSCATPDSDQGNQVMYQGRNFYGVLTIKKHDGVKIGEQSDIIHELYSGSTEHGAQLIANEDLQCTPIGYYSPQGPLGQLFQRYHSVNADWRIGIVGLGAGELAGYARETQQWRYYELNPAVIDIATNPEYFTYLSRCSNNFTIQTGDARLTLENEVQQPYDLLVIDAFTSDSIPTHLLTKEAVELYFSRLKPNGLLVFHISNRHLAFKKVLSDHAETLGLSALLQEFRPESDSPLAHKSDWAVLARHEQVLTPLLDQKQNSAWNKMAHYPDVQTWTDDFTSIVTIWK